MSTLDDLLSGGSKGFKFVSPGDSVTGTIIGSPIVKQATEFGTGKLQTWDDGSPQEQIIITLATDERDPSDPQDDGARSVYIKGWGAQLRAFKAAVQAAGSKPAAGHRFTATFTGLGDRPASGGYPPKVFEYELQPGAALDALVDEPSATAAAAPPQQAAGAAPAATAAPGGGAEKDRATAQSLISMGMTDEVIRTAAPSLSLEIIAAMRNAAA